MFCTHNWAALFLLSAWFLSLLNCCAASRPNKLTHTEDTWWCDWVCKPFIVLGVRFCVCFQVESLSEEDVDAYLSQAVCLKLYSPQQLQNIEVGRSHKRTLSDTNKRDKRELAEKRWESKNNLLSGRLSKKS